ncbi:MAG: MFS transporter [Geminicoccaceae bacterium]
MSRDPALRVLPLAWIAWGLAAIFYAYGFFHRVAPSVLVDDLMLAFRLDAGGVGSLSAAYFYAYAACQIPIGMAIDRFGPRRLIIVAALAASLAGLAFVSAGTAALAWVARASIGAAVGVGYIAAITMASIWFPPHRFARMVGLTLTVGLSGALLAQVPLEGLRELFGWRLAVAIGTGFGVVIALAMALAVPERRGAVEGRDPGMSGLGQLLREPRLWLAGLYTGAMGAAPLAFAGLWCVPYFEQVHGLDRIQAGGLASMMLAAWALGGPLWGGFSDRIARRSRPMVAASALLVAGWLPFLLGDQLPLALLIGALAAIGFAAGGMVIAFAFAAEQVKAGGAGLIAGLVNSSVLLVGAVMQSAMGWTLDWFWAGDFADGVRVYDARAFTAALFLLVAAAASAFIAALAMGEMDPG